MKVKFSRCQSNSLTSVPQEDGQMTYVKDTHEIYMDVNDQRYKVGDIIFINTIAERDAIENPILNKLYYVAEDNTLYHFNEEKTEWEVPKTTAEVTDFDPTETTLEAETVQDAVVELDNKIGDLGALLDKLNGTTDYDDPQNKEEVE